VARAGLAAVAADADGSAVPSPKAEEIEFPRSSISFVF